MIRQPDSKRRVQLRALTHHRYWLTGRRATRQVSKIVGGLTRPGDIVFDVGGQIGFTALTAAARVGDTGQVHVFEPGLLHQTDLQRNLLGFGNVSLINAGVSDRVGKVPFIERDHAYRPTAHALEALRQVHTVTIDNYAMQHALRPAVLRINVPEQVLRILSGARASLRTMRAVSFQATHDVQPIFDLLKEAGFELTTSRGAKITDTQHMLGEVIAHR